MTKSIHLHGKNIVDRFTFDLELKKLFTKNISLINGPKSNNLNLDATRDFLHGGFGFHNYMEKIIIVWDDSDFSKNHLSNMELINYYHDVIKRCHPSNKKNVERDIQIAKDKKETYFDFIVSFLRTIENVDLVLE